MIRPFTLVCMLSAFGAGLYLYQSKHQSQVLDREIGRVLKQTEGTLQRITILRTDWALYNEPDRLAELAKAHLSLQTLKPEQFAVLANLAARLPAPVANNRERLPVEAVPEEVPAVPIAQASPPTPVVAPASPAKVASVAEAKPKSEAKVEAKPEAKPVVRHVEKALVAKMEATAPVQVAAEPTSVPSPIRARPAVHPQAVIASSDATAPGTVGAAVLRAMRAQHGGAEPFATAPLSAPASTPVYTPARSYASPTYVTPSYAPPAYAQPAYAAPAPSMLGGRSTLPPPVPFAAR